MTVTTLHPFQDYFKGFYKLFYFLFFYLYIVETRKAIF
ncbi:hypothetical protein Alsa2_CDS0126 [Staphylococcus phage Alsa_2]|nr:hypothetical protein Alsa2_CDS0126 [Staphylococcus phage Alsa_2]